MTISAPSSYGVVVRCGTPAETAVRSLEGARLQYSVTDGELLAVPVAQSPRDAAAFHEKLARLGYREGHDFAVVVVDEGPLGETPEWLEVTRGLDPEWPEESLATQTEAVRKRLLTPVVLAYSLKKALPCSEEALCSCLPVEHPPAVEALGRALATARGLLRDRVPAAILDTEPVVFVFASEVIFGGPTEMAMPAGALRGMDRFAHEFDVLMRLGYPWVNFEMAGIHEGRLVVVIEMPSTIGEPGRPTSLNVSGPNHAVSQNHGVLDLEFLDAG